MKEVQNEFPRKYSYFVAVYYFVFDLFGADIQSLQS